MKNVLIVVIGNTGSEAEALRQSLEAFGYFVAIKYIGRPNDFVSVLKGELVFEPDSIILSCHGDDGEILMPLLGENVYEPNEPRGNMSGTDIERYLKNGYYVKENRNNIIGFKKIVANKGYSNKSPMLYLAKKTAK